MLDYALFAPQGFCRVFTFPNFDPIIFSIGFINIGWYGLMYVIGFLFAWWLARRRCQRADSIVNAEQVDDLIFYGMLGVILGGRIGYVLVYGWSDLTSDPLYIFKVNQGGMSFHGGLVGVMVAMWWFGRKLGHDMLTVTDFVAPLVPLGLGFGRLGNFINGELWGKETDGWWGVLYNGRVLHPTQLYEAALEGLVLFIILWWFSSKPRPHMAVSGLFLLGYGAGRFIVEFVRVPDSHMGDGGYVLFGWVTTGQILTLPMLVGGLVLMTLAYRRQAQV